MSVYRKACTGLRRWLLALIFAALAAASQGRAIAAEATTPTTELGVQKGICVILGLPEAHQARVVTDLAQHTQLLIYFQSPEAAEVNDVRSVADSQGLLGRRIFVDSGPWKSIHLADNLADVIVVAPAAEKAVTQEELLRVLHPGGKAIFSGRRTDLIKPFPPGIDDWSYPYHGPDNNPQSADQLARAPYLTHFLAEPKFCPSPAVTVAAGGRIFRACGHLAHKANQNAMLNTLLAVNAYNGTILWTRPLADGFMILRNTIIATPETLYLADDKSCKLLDAATGQLKDEIVSPQPDTDGTVWKWMALKRHVLYGLLGDEEFKAPVLRSDAPGVGGWPRANWPGFDYADPHTAWAQGRTLLAIDSQTKHILWRHREQQQIDGRAVCMAAGRIYFLSPGQFLGCLDAATGKVLWKTSDAALLQAIGPLFPQQPRWTGLSPFPYVKCNDRFLLFSGPRMPRVVAVSTADGKLRWQKEVRMNDAGSVHLLLRPDALYAVGLPEREVAPYDIDNPADQPSCSMEYETGKVLSRFCARRGCTVVTGGVDSIFYRAPEGTVRIDPVGGKAEHIAPMRPPCYEGVIIAGGLLYWGAWKCGCPLSLYGTVCVAPAGGFNFHPTVDGSRLELGPGDPTKVEKFAAEADDWPCYQGDNSRTSTTKVALAKQVRRQWALPPASAAMPTAPVAAGGMVFVGDHRGVVQAVDAADGTVKWKVYTGGAVFFPPAVWNGRLYVGSADGHVYAFEAASGRLLWRFRAAPAQRWIPILGKLISTWPVAGGVVVADGVVYAAAGIAHYDGTYVYALDAMDGKLKWLNDSSGRLSAENGNGISLQGNLYLSDGQLCFAGGNVYAVARYDLKTGQCVTAPQPRILAEVRTAFYPYYPEYGQYMPFSYTLADGRFLDYAAHYSGALHSTLALFAPPPAGADQLAPNWRVLPPRQQPRTRPPIVWEHKSNKKFHSFIVARDALLAAGQTALPEEPQSFLTAISINDGSPLWRERLPAPVVKGGTAVDHAGRIFISLEDGRVLCFAPSSN